MILSTVTVVNRECSNACSVIDEAYAVAIVTISLCLGLAIAFAITAWAADKFN